MFISQDTDDFKLFLRSCGGKVESNLQILLLAVHPVSTFWVFFFFNPLFYQDSEETDF